MNRARLERQVAILARKLAAARAAARRRPGAPGLRLLTTQLEAESGTLLRALEAALLARDAREGERRYRDLLVSAARDVGSLQGAAAARAALEDYLAAVLEADD